MYSIYALLDPRTEMPRYVGRTKHSLKDRLDRHWGYRTRHTCCKEWLIELEAAGLRPVMQLLEECEVRDGVEEKWIKIFFMCGFELLNKYQLPVLAEKRQKHRKLTREQNRRKQASWRSRHAEARNEWQRNRRQFRLANEPGFAEKERQAARDARERMKLRKAAVTT